MREIKSLSDAQIVLKELTQWKDKLSTKDHDMKKLRIKNASPGVDPNDYATVSQLPPAVTIPGPPDQYYTMCWNSTGPVSNGVVAAGFTAGRGRTGIIYEAILECTSAPNTGNLVVNVQINGTDVINGNLTIPEGQNGPVSTGNFVSPNFKIGHLTKVLPVIINAGGAAYVFIGLVIKVNLTNA